MNRRIVYMAIAVVSGLLLGYFLFGGNATERETDSHKHDTVEGQLWTCSMHPQIIRSEPGNCPICGMELIPLGKEGEGLTKDQIKMSDNAMALADIRTTVVGDGPGSEGNTITLSGKIMENAGDNSVQASYFGGRLEKLNVNYEGQQIRRGQLLATIYSPELVAAQQELLTAASLRESQPALYRAVRAKLRNWKLTEAQIDNIEETGKVREHFPVYATVTGTVTKVMAAEGNYVAQGQPLLMVNDLGTVWAELDAYENQVPLLKEGQEIKLITNAYPSREFNAKISFLDPVLNTATRTVTVRATLDNSENILKPGMFVTGRVEMVTDVGEKGLRIPATALLWTGERSLVYVRSRAGEPIFEMREVTVGQKIGEEYAILGGLKAGEEIVTHGTFTVDAAAQLQGKRSMMNQARERDSTNQDMAMELSPSLQNGLQEFFGPYLNLKDAFVASNAGQVASTAKASLQSLKEIGVSGTDAMGKAHLSKIKEMLEAMGKSKDLKDQRAHFVVLNQQLVPLARNMQGTATTLYVQQCPMANDNKGALWLSKEEIIKNPYYGAQMMDCGSVVDTIPQREQN